MGLRGQYALEQMGVIALALVIIAALFFFSMNAASDGARSSQAKDTAERIARAADSAYALGPGSKATVSVNMPQGVQFVDTSNKRVWIRVALSSGNSDVFAKTSGQIVGSIPTTAELQEITMTVLPNGNISVGRQSLSCSPASFTKTIVQGGSSSDTLFLFNSWVQAISSVSSSVSGVSDMATAGSPPGTVPSGSYANISLSFSVPGAKPVGTYTGAISVNGSNGTACASSITIFVTSSAPADVLGPTVSGILATPSNLTTITPATISATATDANNSIAACLLQLDSSGVWNTMDASDGSYSAGTETIAYYIGFLSLGNHTVGIYCLDTLGNAGAQSSYNLSISNATGGGSTDTQGPIVSNLSVFASSSSTNVSVTAWEHTNGTATCPASTTISGWTSIYGINCPNFNSTSCSSCTIGAASCTVNFENAVCGSDPCVGTLKMGQINITCESSQVFTTSSIIMVNATASDATTGGSKVMFCRLQLDGGSPSYMSAQGGVYNSVEINVSSQLGTLAPGSHNVSVYCRDFSDNQGPTVNATFSIIFPPLCAYSRTDPTGAQYAPAVSSIAGYCLAISPTSNTISYNYTWYLNGAVNESGAFTVHNETNATVVGTPSSFAYDAGFTAPASANDGNYATYASYTAFSTSSMYWNYTNPGNSTNQTIWQTKHGLNGTANDTLPLACAARTMVQLRITANNSNSSQAEGLSMSLVKNYTKSTVPCGLLASRWMAMDWANSRAYISVSGLDALTVMDFSDPSSLSCRGSIADTAPPGSLDGIWGGSLDTTSNIFYGPSLTDDTISVYNVTGATPVYMAGTAAVSGNPYSLDGVVDIAYIDISGSRLLVASSSTDSVLSVYNATNRLASPTGLYTYSKAANPCAINAPYKLQFIPGTTYLMVASSGIDTFTILNISANGVLTCVGTYASSTPPYSVDGLQDFYYESEANLVYVPAVTDSYLTILNVANPASIAAVGEVYLGTTGVSVAVNTVGDRKFAFVGSTTAGKGIKVVDVTNPSSLVVNGTFNQTSGTCVYNTVYGIASSGNMLYATSGGDSCFYAIQLSTPLVSNHSQSSKFCYNGSAWAPLGANSAATNNFSAANIYEQNVFFSTSGVSSLPILNNTEYLVDTLSANFSGGQAWSFTCTAYDGTDVASANSSQIAFTG